MCLLELDLQNPPPGPFSFSDLKWVSVKDNQTGSLKENTVVQTVQVARVPWGRRQDFLDGEGTRGTCTFYSRKSERKTEQRLADLSASRTPRKDTFLEYQIRHCNHGPENHTESGDVLAEKQQGQRRGKRQRGDGVRLGCQVQGLILVIKFSGSTLIAPLDKSARSCCSNSSGAGAFQVYQISACAC